MKVILLCSLLVQRILLLIKSLLEAYLVLLQTVSIRAQGTISFSLLLLLCHSIVLNKSLLKHGPEPQALVRVRLHLTLVLSMLCKLDILLELLDLSLLHLILQFHLAVLALQLLD